MVSWMRRGVAFIIDYTLFMILWNVIDNIISIPFADGLFSIGSAIFFCLYFIITEGRGKHHASLGKRITRIKVVSRNDQSPTMRSIIERSAILALIIVLDWGKVLSIITFPSTSSSMMMISLVSSVPIGIILFNAFLSIRGPGRIMLHDGLTYTQVIRSEIDPTKALGKVETPLHPVKREWPKPAVCAMLVIVVSLVWVSLYGIPPTIVNKNLEKEIVQKLGVRSRCHVANVRYGYYQAGPFSFEVFTEQRIGHFIQIEHEKMIRTLEISIWIPFIVWDKTLLPRIIEVALPLVTFPPGYFDAGKVTLHTGVGIINISYDFELNFPTALMVAASGGDIYTVKKLLDKGVDTHLKNIDGKTALEYAKENRHSEIIDLIEQHEVRDH